MIVKGKARSGPAELAAYLMRTKDGERATILTPGVTEDGLYRDFMTWHVAGEGTRGEKTLYHAQICPDPRHKMTPEQYLAAARMLGEDLGMAGHPFRVVLHDGGDKPHAHVVFQRADLQTMTMWNDSFNYVKHERASLRMAKEFGMEIVPGKHAKRDRRKQPEFPRAKLSEAEAQYEKRTGVSKEDRVKQIAALHAASDSGAAFKAALEDAGYILAKGNRGYVVVDQAGGQSVLTRNVGLKKKDLEPYMAGVGLDKLPTVEEAKALQAERRKGETVLKSDSSPDLSSEARRAKEEALAKGERQAAPEQRPEKKGVEASKFMPPDSTSKPPEPSPAPAQGAGGQPQPDPELEALKKAIADREAAEVQKWAAFHAQERKQLEFELNKENRNGLALRDADDLKAMQALKEQIRERTRGVKGLIEAIENRLNPGLGAQRAEARRREIVNLQRRHAKERKDYAVLLEQVKQEQLDNLKERQNLQLRDAATKRAEERERHVRDFQEARRLREQLRAEDLKKDLKKTDTLKDGPPPPKLGK